MKKLIFKKLLKDITNFFIISTLSISVIIWVIQAVNYLDFVSEDGHSFRIYFLYTLLSLPKIISRVLPFMFFISIFYILVKYEEENELVIFWLNGIKKIKFVNTLVVFSIIFLFIQLFMSSYLIPTTQDTARSFIRTSNIDSFPNLIKEKKFIDTVSNLTLYVDEKDENGIFKNLVLKDEIDKTKSQIIYAEQGKIVKKNNKFFLILSEGTIINKDKQSTDIFNFSSSQFNLSKFETKTTTFPKIQEINTIHLTECLLFLKANNIVNEFNSRILQCNNENLEPVQRELFKRFLLPFYIPLLALFVSTLILTSKDKFTYSKSKVKVFLGCVVLIIISEMSIRYIDKESLMALIFISMPFLLFIFTYTYMTQKLKENLN